MTKISYDVQVITHSIHVRTSAVYKADGSNVKTYAHNGNKFTASKEQNGWYYIDSLGGWMKAKGIAAPGTYLKITKKTIPTATSTANKPKPAPKTVVDDKPKQEVSNTNTPEKTTTYDNPNMGNVKTITSKSGTSKGVTSHVETMMGKASSTNLNSLEGWGKIPKGFKLDYDDLEDSFASIRRNHNIMVQSDRLRLFRQFNRFKMAVPDFAVSKTIPYVFFTRPELDIINSDGKTLKVNDNLFSAVHNSQPRIIQSLDSSYHDGHHFNPLLSNAAMSFQASDEVLKTVDHGDTYTGWKMVYGRHANESNTAGQFSIQYTDSYNYDIYKMHKVWVDYISKVYRGELSVKRKHIWEKVLTYPCAVYYIVCAPDGETILYWTKYFGVFPINTPASASSFTHGSVDGIPEFSINYMYSIKEDFNPISLREFNFLSSGDNIYRHTYNQKTTGPTNTFVGTPYIDDVERVQNGQKQIVHKLRFRDK